MGFIGKPAAVPSKALLKTKFDHVPSFNGVDYYGNQEWMLTHYQYREGTEMNQRVFCARSVVVLFIKLT